MDDNFYEDVVGTLRLKHAQILDEIKALQAEAVKITGIIAEITKCVPSVAATVAVTTPMPRRKYTRRQKPETAPAEPEPPAKRKGKQPQTAEQAHASMETVLTAPTTLGGAMKRYLLSATEPKTAAQVEEHIRATCLKLIEGKSDGAVYANLSYWASKGYVEKVGTGNLATFRVLDMAFLQESET